MKILGDDSAGVAGGAEEADVPGDVVNGDDAAVEIDGLGDDVDEGEEDGGDGEGAVEDEDDVDRGVDCGVDVGGVR